MPIYEFFCPDCNTFYNFLSRTISVSKSPSCPRCEKDTLERQVSRFATLKNRSGADSDDASSDLGIDETKMEQAISKLASEMDSVDENDPRQAAQIMRKISDAAGMQYTDTIEEALCRLESGEDPEKLEEQMGSIDDESQIFQQGKKIKSFKNSKPTYDSNLYEM